SGAASPPGIPAVLLIADTSSAERLISAPPITVVQMGDRTSLPEVGAEFNGSGAEVGAVSTVTRDGSSYTFSLILGRNSEAAVREVFAPFASALEQNKAPEFLPLIVSEARAKSVPLALRENTYSSTAKLTLDGGGLAPLY